MLVLILGPTYISSTLSLFSFVIIELIHHICSISIQMMIDILSIDIHIFSIFITIVLSSILDVIAFIFVIAGIALWHMISQHRCIVLKALFSKP
ncbi:hypothetical protein BGX38DRAFT_1154416 [Terfezia claveryi]|nr:hypothetical protein BGX38DRAFT_1154416 [Terfezia claveryi]